MLNFATRLLLTLPFVVVTFFYLQLTLAENGCWGLIELIYSVILWVLLAVTFLLALVATLRKRQSERLRTDRYLLSVTLVTLTVLIVGGLWGDKLKGSAWIEATTKDYVSKPSSQDLTLRKNGTFTVYVNEADFSCYYTGNYQKTGDTLHFNEQTIAKTNSKMTTHYLLSEKKILPLFDPTKDDNQYLEFDIVAIE